MTLEKDNVGTDFIFQCLVKTLKQTVEGALFIIYKTIHLI